MLEPDNNVLHFSFDLEYFGLFEQQGALVALVSQDALIIVAVKAIVLGNAHYLHLLRKSDVLQLLPYQQLGCFDEFGD